MDYHLRLATLLDLKAIVALLMDDPLGNTREVIDLSQYEAALEAILSDPNNAFWVLEIQKQIIGCYQLTFIPGLSHQGALRAQLESVRVHADYRGKGIGAKMILRAIGQAKEKGANLIQLTSHEDRGAAHQFYKKLGFQATHIGFKKKL